MANQVWDAELESAEQIPRLWGVELCLCVCALRAEDCGRWVSCDHRLLHMSRAGIFLSTHCHCLREACPHPPGHCCPVPGLQATARGHRVSFPKFMPFEPYTVPPQAWRGDLLSPPLPCWFCSPSMTPPPPQEDSCCPGLGWEPLFGPSLIPSGTA